MKSVRAIMIVAFAAFLAGTFAIAQSDEGKPDAPHAGRGPGGGPGVMLDHLLPQPVVDDLKLTAEQKTKYIDLEAKKETRRRDEGHVDDEDEEMQRLWYMPWKKVPVSSTSTKGGKVPLSWLETDITQGLSLPEIEMRRARFGYNELERYVNQK